MSLLLLDSDSATQHSLVASTNAVIQGHETQVATTNASVRVAFPSTATDAYILFHLFETTSENAIIVLRTLLAETTDAVIKAKQTKTPTTNAAIQAHLSKTWTTNAILSGTHFDTTSTDAVITAKQTKSATTNAVLEVLKKQYTTNAVIQGNQTKTPSTNAIILAKQSRSLTLDAVIKAILQRTATTDANEIFRIAVNIPSMAIVAGERSVTPQSNAIIAFRTGLPLLANAVIDFSSIGSPAPGISLSSGFARILINQPPTPQEFAYLFSKAYELYATTLAPTPLLPGRRQLMEAGLVAAFSGSAGGAEKAINGIVSAFTAFWIGCPVPGGLVTSFLGAEALKNNLRQSFAMPSGNQAGLAVKLARCLVSATHTVQYVIPPAPPAFFI